MIKLADLTLGYADGKNEAEKAWFTDLFYTENHMVDRVLNERSVFIISGRKGTGKTILAKYIEKTHRETGSLTKVVGKEELFLNYILEKTADPLNQAELSAFLRYCILMAVAKLMIEQEKMVLYGAKIPHGIISVARCKAKLWNLKRFYYDVYPRGAFKTSSSELEVAGEGSASTNRVLPFSFKSKVSRKSMLHRKQYFELLDELEKLVLSVAEFTDFFVFFDDLDELESRQFLAKETGNIFTTLLETMQSINAELFAKGMKRSKVVVLLRQDILEDLNARCSNLNKMTIDGSVNLNWIKSTENNETHPLVDLVLSKIQKKCFPGKSKTDIFAEIFGSVRHINKRPLVKFLIEHSFGRPRDIITYLNIMIEKYPDKNKFDVDMFTNLECKREYSKRFSAELKNELSIHYSESEIMQLFNLLKKYGRRTFYFAGIEQFYANKREEFVEIENLKEGIEIMYKFGIVGNTWPNAATGQYCHAWAYREDGYPDADFSKKFCVHHALRRELNLA